MQLISGLDFSESGLSPAQQQAVRQELQLGSLLAQGRNVRVPNQGPAGDGIDLVVYRAFLEARPPPRVGPLDFQGTYLVTLDPGSGKGTVGSLTLREVVPVIYARFTTATAPEATFTGVGTVDGDLLHLSLTSVPGGARPAAITFSGRGTDNDGDSRVDRILGHYATTECRDTCEDVVGDFDAAVEPDALSGTYPVTLTYGNGTTREATVTLIQTDGLVTAELVYEGGLALFGNGTVRAGEFWVTLGSAAPVAEPQTTNLSFNGTGVDLNGDGRIEAIRGDFAGTECVDTCDDVVGDFD
jgi:hypothetical protein